MRFAKNLAWLVISEGVSRAVQFVALGYLARVLGTAGLGVFNWVQSVGLMLALLPNFGLNEYGILKVSPNRSPGHIGHIASEILSFRFILGLCSLAGLAVATLTIPQFVAYRGLLLTGGVLLIATMLTFDWFYTAVERQATVGIARLVARLSYLAGTLLFVKTADDLLMALLLFFGTELVLSITLFALSFRVTPWNFFWPGAARAGAVLSQAWPLAIYAANAGLLYYVDIVIIGLRLPMADAGLYAGGMRIVTGLIALKYLLGQLVYPKLVRRVGAAEKSDLRRLLSVIDRYGLILGISVLTLTVMFARELVWLVLGPGFVSGWWVVAVLGLTLLAEFGWLAYPYLVLSMNQRVYAAILALAGVLKVGALYLLLPRGGLAAATAVYLAGSLLVFLLSIGFVHRRLDNVSIVRLVFVPLTFAAAAVSFALFQPPLLWRVTAAVALIGAAILYLRAIGQAFEWSRVKDDLLVINA